MDCWRDLIEAEHFTFVPAEAGGIVRPRLGEGFEAGCLDCSKPAVRWFGQRLDAVAPVGNLPCNQLVKGLAAFFDGDTVRCFLHHVARFAANREALGVGVDQVCWIGWADL